jgi:glycosyltransferase involved in cell wall biosynthesis
MGIQDRPCTIVAPRTVRRETAGGYDQHVQACGHWKQVMKIIFSATTSWNLYNSRRGLAHALVNHGHEVVLLSPRDEFTEYLMQEGFRWVHLPLKPRGKNVFFELAAILFMASFFRREKPDLVNLFTPKAVIYGSIAARAAGIRSIFNTITGLGSVFAGRSGSALQALVMLLYRIALANTTVLFQNKDDKGLFLKKRIVRPERSFLVPGSGVDMERFKLVPEPDGIPTVILPSRFVEEKGIRYFVEAARILKSRQVEARFVLVGRPEDDQPTTIRHLEITEWMNAGLIEWWGWHNSMDRIYPLAHIVCLPTYYMEGMPKSLIEAAACGRPLVATDVPGCREVVQDRYNGILVPPRNAVVLADAIAELVADPALRQEMGERGREFVATKFSIENIVAEYFAIYDVADAGV